MKLSDFVSSFIAKQNVKHVFLLPGGGNMHLIDSVGKQNGLSIVACLHEQAAAIAADGYAQASNNLGVALVTTGPGGTNAITGVTGSWIESVPVMVLSGQVKRPDLKPTPNMRMLGFQEIDIVTIVKSITKYAVTITEPDSILYHLEKAAHLAMTGRRGPVWIDIPLDVQAAEIDETKLKGFTPEKPVTSCKTEVQQVVKILSEAKRPVVLAGNGIRLSGAEKAFMQLVEKLNIPVLTTWKAVDLMSDEHPDYYGRPGTVAHRGANFIQQNSDCIISIGCRLDFGQIGYAQETFAREAKKIIVDIDALEFIKFRFNVDVKVVADALDFLNELSSQLKDFVKPNWSEWLKRCQDWKGKYPLVTQEYLDRTDYVSTYLVVDEVAKQLTGNDVIVPCSSGSGADITSMSFKIKKGQRMLNSPGLGSMGFGVPQTLGACIASGNKRTVCLNGDGGFQLNIQELETIKRLKLPIKFIYLNNQGYLSIKVSQNNYFNGRLVATDDTSGLTLPDIQKVSAAYGIPSNRILNNKGMEQGIKEALATDGPFICEVMIDPDEQVSPKVKSALINGKMVSKPLEDLAPFLDRKEFLENMIVKPLEE
jgi:acetolactate synthase-1/2/3 large subunit